MPKIHIPDWVKDIPPEVIEEEKRKEEERRRREEDRPYAPPPSEEPPPDWEPDKDRPQEDDGNKRGVEIIQL